MAMRLIDLIGATAGLLFLGPVILLAWIAVRWADPDGGPAMYRAHRVGRLGRPFIMYKLRTMRGAKGPRSADRSPRITGASDPRVFPLGRVLRRTKIDELPQLWNVIRGEMALVGPRPEDPAIMRRYYTAADYDTLAVRPGLASPGSLYQYTHGDALLAGGDPERRYVERLMPIKLALERVYVRHACLRYDLSIIARTLRVILASALGGRRQFPEPPELPDAQRLLRSATAPARVPAGEPVTERA